MHAHASCDGSFLDSKTKRYESILLETENSKPSHGLASIKYTNGTQRSWITAGDFSMKEKCIFGIASLPKKKKTLDEISMK